MLAGAAVIFLVAAPLCAVAQEAVRTEAGITDTPKLIEIPAAAREHPAATDPLAILDPADRAIAERTRDILQPKPNRIFANENELVAVEAFYQKRNYAPLWLEKGAENARSKAVIARLKNADTDGLDPTDYRTPSLAGLASDALAEAELTLTQAVLTYARHVQAGRAPHRMVRDSNIGLPQKAPDPAEVLQTVAEAADAAKALDQFSPPHEPYQKLKAALAELRASASGGRKDHSTRDRRIDTVIANMERWRWYRRDLGAAHIEVNEADFSLKVVQDGRQIWASRIVIGMPSMPSPLLSEKMVSITVNPTWHVPPSIVQNEYLPAQRRDPGVLARMGIRVERKDGEVQMFMSPGGENPLGRIRFNFYNRFLVFQHDSPDQYLFAHKVRAESHGCMRVQDAPKYAEILSGIAHPEEQWTAARIRSTYRGPEYEIDLQSVPIWIHLTYQTAFVDGTGKLEIRPDIYNLDRRTLAAIKSAHTISPAAPAPETKSAPAIAAPAPAAPARHRKAVHRASPRQGQVTTTGYPPVFFGGGTRF
jgi:murein L,D-transpeptidase YcbB/YkuD